MISPLQVIHQILDKQTPSNWLILRPSHLSSPIMHTVLGSFGGIFTMVFGTLLVTGIAEPTLLHQSTSNLFGQLLITIPMALLSVMVSIIIATGIAKSSKRKSDSALVLLPEGVVSCKYMSDEVKRYWNVIEYTNVTRINMIIEKRYYKRVSLNLQYRGGEWERWRIESIYGSPEWIAQRVIKDHFRFVLSHPENSRKG